MRRIIIIAGPNGAGKTSFANEYPPARKARLAYLNADQIARELAAAPAVQQTSAPGPTPTQLDLRAGREMLARIDALVAAGAELMFETTLALVSYARRIPAWRSRGYTVALIYLRLASVEMSIARVRKRVAAGGHGIPESTIRQRFARSAAYLESHYKPIVDEWYIWDSLDGEFRLAEAWSG